MKKVGMRNEDMKQIRTKMKPHQSEIRFKC